MPISAEAAEGGPYEEGLGEGDTITVVFNKPTNVIPLGSNDRVYGLFNLSSSLGVLNAYVNRRGAVSTSAGCQSFGPMAQCVVHALKGLACRARATPASSPASHCKHRDGSVALRPLPCVRATLVAAPVSFAHVSQYRRVPYKQCEAGELAGVARARQAGPFSACTAH